MVEPEDTATDSAGEYPVWVRIKPATENRNRLTAAFRFFLSIPHIILVGAPIAMVSEVSWSTEGGGNWEISSGGGLVGLVALFAVFFAWFAILFIGRHPEGLWKVAAYYMRWRVRATAYMTLLRDEYPPFGEGEYPARLELTRPIGPRDRLTVAFRFFLALPHIVIVGLLGLAWSFTTAVAWAWILLTGRYPPLLYGFALGVFSWGIRVESYMLLLRDEYPPFTLRAYVEG